MKFSDLFEGDVVRINQYAKPPTESAKTSSDDWKHPMGWGTHADRAAWSSQSAVFDHQKSKPEVSDVDRLSAGGNMVPGVPTAGLQRRVSWAVSSPELFSGHENTILDHHMRAHGFSSSEGGGKTTETPRDAWSALEKGTVTTKQNKVFRNNLKAGGYHHFIDVTKDSDGFRWEHYANKERYGGKGYGKKLRGSGNDYQSLETHLAKHWPERDEGDPKDSWSRWTPKKVKYSSGKTEPPTDR